MISSLADSGASISEITGRFSLVVEYVPYTLTLNNLWLTVRSLLVVLHEELTKFKPHRHAVTVDIEASECL